MFLAHKYTRLTPIKVLPLITNLYFTRRSKLVTKINPKNFEHIMLKAMKEHKARVEAVALTFTSMSNFKLKLHKEM